jgi:hypothetical protein
MRSLPRAPRRRRREVTSHQFRNHLSAD